MKIAYLSRGNEVWDRRLLEKIVECGHETYFISYFPDKQVDVKGVQNHFYDYTSMHRFPRLLSLQTALHLRKILNIICPDVLHTGWIPDMGFFGALSGFHPTLSMPWGSDILLKPDESRFLKWITRYTLRQADKITCDCELVKNKIVQISGSSPDKIVVIPCGIDLKTFCPLNYRLKKRRKLGWQENKILIMTRNMKKSLYGHDIFLGALPSVIKSDPATRVILVGDGPLKPTYQKNVSKYGLEEYVHFAGWVNDKEMAEYLNSSDIYISAAVSDGTSISLLEAMACGLPVVVTDAPANLEWIKDDLNGYIVPINDSQMLANGLIKLLQNKDLRLKMGERNIEIARDRADWEKNFDIFEGIYQDLFSKTKR